MANEKFTQIIGQYLDQRAKEDPQFAAKRAEVNRSTEEVCKLIISAVQSSHNVAFADDEIYGMAVHFAEEKEVNIKAYEGAVQIITPSYELTEEDKEAAKAAALKQFQDEQFNRLKNRNKPAAKKEAESSLQLSLFDDL